MKSLGWRGWVESHKRPEGTLSKREREVVRLMAEGKSTKEIADILCVSLKTIETHRFNIYCSLDIHDVVSLVWYAIENCLVNERLTKALRSHLEHYKPCAIEAKLTAVRRKASVTAMKPAQSVTPMPAPKENEA